MRREGLLYYIASRSPQQRNENFLPLLPTPYSLLPTPYFLAQHQQQQEAKGNCEHSVNALPEFLSSRD